MTGPKGALAALLPLVPTARREFEFTDRVTAFVRISRAGQPALPTVVVARVLDTHGQVAFEDRRDMNGDDYEVVVPVETLPAGQYLLDIRASAGKDEVTRSVRFTVR